MHSLVSMLASALSQDFSTTFRHYRRDVILYAFAVLFAVTAYAVVIACGIYYALQQAHGPLEVAAVAGAVFATLAATMVFVVKLLHWRDRRRARRFGQTGLVAVSIAASLLPQVMGKKSTVAAVAAGALAYFLYTRGQGGPDQNA